MHKFKKKICSPCWFFGRLPRRPAQSIKIKNHKTLVKTYRIFMSSFAVIVFVSVSPISLIPPVSAIETTSAEVIKSSAINMEKVRANSYSFNKKLSPKNEADPCRTLLKAHISSPNVLRHDHAFNAHRHAVSASATPVALGLFLGARIALGPKDIVKTAKRVKIGPEIRASGSGGQINALAIAAYRSCKNNHVLSLQNKNKKSNVND